MDKLLSILGLKKSFQIKLDIEKTEFVEHIGEDIKPNQLFLFDMFDTNQKKYYGNIDQNGFMLRSSRRSSSKSSFSRAFGTINRERDKVNLDVFIVGWNWFILIFMVIMFLILGLAINDLIACETYGALIMFIPVFLFFILVPVFKMRKGVKRFEKYLIADLKEINTKI